MGQHLSLPDPSVNDHTKPRGMAKMPTELLEMVLAHLELRDLYRCKRVSKYWKECIEGTCPEIKEKLWLSCRAGAHGELSTSAGGVFCGMLRDERLWKLRPSENVPFEMVCHLSKAEDADELDVVGDGHLSWASSMRQVQPWMSRYCVSDSHRSWTPSSLLIHPVLLSMSRYAFHLEAIPWMDGWVDKWVVRSKGISRLGNDGQLHGENILDPTWMEMFACYPPVKQMRLSLDPRRECVRPNTLRQLHGVLTEDTLPSMGSRDTCSRVCWYSINAKAGVTLTDIRVINIRCLPLFGQDLPRRTTPSVLVKEDGIRMKHVVDHIQAMIVDIISDSALNRGISGSFAGSPDYLCL